MSNKEIFGDYAICVDGIDFSYVPNDSNNIFTNFSYSFQKNKITAITGVSGKGKSTLLYILGLMLTIKKGKIIINEKDFAFATDKEKSKIRSNFIGFVFQDSALDPTKTLQENIIEPTIYAQTQVNIKNEQSTRSRALRRHSFFKTQHQKQQNQQKQQNDKINTRAKFLLEKFGLADQSQKKSTKISGGQGQRAALARALINFPQIILADEPTGNLDSQNASIILNEFKDFANSGGCVIIATHDDRVLELVDEVVSL